MPYARQDKIRWTQGAYYHLYNRGVHRFTIFPDEHAYLFAIQRIKETCLRFNFALVAYCLMPNHYHFCVRQDGEVWANQLPRRVFNSYSKWFNRRYDHSGTLFEGRFQAIKVDTDAYLRRLCLYIHANPVRDGIALRPELWPYSNYLEWLGWRNGTLFDSSFLADHFDTPSQYRQCMADYLAERSTSG